MSKQIINSRWKPSNYSFSSHGLRFFPLLTIFCAVRRVRQTNYTNFRSLHKPRGVCRRHQRQERIKCHAERVKAACRDVFTMTPPPPPRYISSRRFSNFTTVHCGYGPRLAVEVFTALPLFTYFYSHVYAFFRSKGWSFVCHSPLLVLLLRAGFLSSLISRRRLSCLPAIPSTLISQVGGRFASAGMAT